MVIKVLGSGASLGVPLLTCICSTCRSSDIKDKRQRSSLLISIHNKNILIDIGPDFRKQALQNNIQHQMIINVNGRTNVNDIDSPTFSEIGIVIDFPTVYDNA